MGQGQRPGLREILPPRAAPRHLPFPSFCRRAGRTEDWKRFCREIWASPDLWQRLGTTGLSLSWWHVCAPPGKPSLDTSAQMTTCTGLCLVPVGPTGPCAAVPTALCGRVSFLKMCSQCPKLARKVVLSFHDCPCEKACCTEEPLPFPLHSYFYLKT